MTTKQTTNAAQVHGVVSTAEDLASRVASGNTCFCVLRDKPGMRLLPRAVIAVAGDRVLIECWENRWIDFKCPTVNRWEFVSS